jgi:hypothetical protein
MSATIFSSYRTRPANTLRPFDQLPAEARAALADAVENWVPPPILTAFRRGEPGFRGGVEIAERIEVWNIVKIAEREKKRNRGAGPYKGCRSVDQPAGHTPARGR